MLSFMCDDCGHVAACRGCGRSSVSECENCGTRTCDDCEGERICNVCGDG